MEGNKIVLKASKGIIFRMQEEKDGVIVVEAIHESENEAQVYNYQNPYIPQGFEHVKGEWKNGFTIRNKEDGSEFTWIPVGFIEPDGTLDGKNFNERFGRRNFKGEEFSEKEYHEEVDQEMLESIKKYGGLYFSSYLAFEQNDEVVFKKGNMPWVNIDQIHAKAAAEHYSDGNDEIVTRLPSGAVYDTVFKWIIQNGEKTFDDVVNDSTKWGNYYNTPKSPKMVTPTGSNVKWCVLNIWDLAGNCDEWSTELIDSSLVVSRGGGCDYNGYGWPAAERNYFKPDSKCNDTSFRSVLYKK